MIERSQIEAVKYRIAVAALDYHPNKATVEPGYTVDEDLDWCLAGLDGLSASTMADIREAAETAIIDPTANRQRLTRTLDTLLDAGDTDRS